GIYKDEIPLKIIAVKNKDDVLLSRTRYRSWKYIKRGILNVGDYTVGKIRIIGDLDIGKITIGNYTTISDNVIFNFDNFDISNISSYNFEKNMLISHKKESQEKRKKKNSTNEIIIGNDVFISENVEILSGSKIGDGAIILPNSKVNKSIEPYSINSGSPCVIKGYRYSIENIKKMEKLQWWNWDKAVINSRIADLSSEKIDDFITKYYKFTV
ncbi:MAG: hypothetical protein K6B64_03515, partial [Acholeplasmatales bacterium]|nr:hypothetical protein [Acholeplasmatales bacterium]